MVMYYKIEDRCAVAIDASDHHPKVNTGLNLHTLVATSKM